MEPGKDWEHGKVFWRLGNWAIEPEDRPRPLHTVVRDARSSLMKMNMKSFLHCIKQSPKHCICQCISRYLKVSKSRLSYLRSSSPRGRCCMPPSSSATPSRCRPRRPSVNGDGATTGRFRQLITTPGSESSQAP
jgi:hypothetical protein